jgi:parvulin-like peptidyl-prolyl isomerase
VYVPENYWKRSEKIMKIFLTSSLVVFLIFGAEAQAQDSAASAELGASTEPLAVMGDVTLTQGEIDAALSKIPENKRLLFIRDGNKVEQLVRSLITNKALANEAIKAGYDQQKLVKMRLELNKEAELAQDWLSNVATNAPEADFEAIAEEKYLVKPEAWKTEDRIDVSHILISTDGRSRQEAMDLAGYVWQQLDLDPLSFDSLVEEYSDDSSKSVNGGRFKNVKRNDMVPNFEKVAFALAVPGQISAPTETNYGFHIIRLNEKMPGTIPPFDAIKEQAIEQARVEYRKEYREKYLRQLLSGNIVLQDGAAEALAKRYFGENLELAPRFSE